MTVSAFSHPPTPPAIPTTGLLAIVPPALSASEEVKSLVSGNWPTPLATAPLEDAA